MKVLVIDDDPDIQLITGEALRRLAGFDVVSCEDAHQAIEMVRVENPDLILLDYHMPEMNGQTLLKKLKTVDDEHINDIPVIFLTGISDPDLSKKLIKIGAKGIIKKPFSFKELPDKIRQLLESE